MQYCVCRDAVLFEVPLCGTQHLMGKKLTRTHIRTSSAEVFKVEMEISGQREIKVIIAKESSSPGLLKQIYSVYVLCSHP